MRDDERLDFIGAGAPPTTTPGRFARSDRKNRKKSDKNKSKERKKSPQSVGAQEEEDDEEKANLRENTISSCVNISKKDNVGDSVMEWGTIGESTELIAKVAFSGTATIDEGIVANTKTKTSARRERDTEIKDRVAKLSEQSGKINIGPTGNLSACLEAAPLLRVDNDIAEAFIFALRLAWYEIHARYF